MANGRDLIVAVGEAVEPLALIQRVADRTLDLIEPAVGVMVGLADASSITYVAGSGNQVALVGTSVGLDSSLSGLAVRTGELQHCDDIELDPRVDLEACRRHLVRSLVCLPLRRGADALGVLAVNAPTSAAFDPQHLDTLTRLAGFMSIAIGTALDLHDASMELIGLEHAADGDERAASQAHAAQSYVLGVVSPSAATRLEAQRPIQRILDEPELLAIKFQPVVELSTMAPIAVEALARFGVAPDRSPDHWFADAHACDLGVELELLAVQRAIALIDTLPDDLSVTLNIGPEAAVSPEMHTLLGEAPLDRVVLELTEHAAVDDYPGLIAALRPLRRRGLRIAVDDTGSGYSSLAHILKIAPEFIKLDCELTLGIDIDPVRRALAASLVAFAADTGAEIIAEGVENEHELVVLRGLGIRYGQGFHLGRPMPVEAIAAMRPRVARGGVPRRSAARLR
jgi:EAL domain-containing protein (putative c-di-GMP-specific phosphodiesterase class I)